MSNIKHCPRCHCITIVKIGKTNTGRQRYYCKACHGTWSSKAHSGVKECKIWLDYALEDLKINQICQKYNLGKDKVRAIINRYEVPDIIPTGKPTVIAMDCTYFGRQWGLLIAIDVHTGECLYLEEIGGYETIMNYQRAIMYLINEYDIHPQACIVDGKKGMYQMLEYYHIKPQLCQFHQLQTINQYLTRNPVLEPNIELRRIALTLSQSQHRAFYTMFNAWRWKYQAWLKERTYNPETGKREYTHQDTRKAAKSLLINMPYLFTYEHYPELHIPKTNNMLEGVNSAIKHKLNHHRGARKDLKIKLTRTFLSNRTEV